MHKTILIEEITIENVTEKINEKTFVKTECKGASDLQK